MQKIKFSFLLFESPQSEYFVRLPSMCIHLILCIYRYTMFIFLFDVFFCLYIHTSFFNMAESVYSVHCTIENYCVCSRKMHVMNHLSLSSYFKQILHMEYTAKIKVSHLRNSIKRKLHRNLKIDSFMA